MEKRYINRTEKYPIVYIVKGPQAIGKNVMVSRLCCDDMFKYVTASTFTIKQVCTAIDNKINVIFDGLNLDSDIDEVVSIFRRREIRCVLIEFKEVI